MGCEAACRWCSIYKGQLICEDSSWVQLHSLCWHSASSYCFDHGFHDMIFHISIHVFALMATLREHQGKGMLQIQNVKGLNPFYKQCCMPISSSCQQPTYTTCLAGLSYPRLLILISDCFVAAGCPCTPWCQIIIFLSLLLTDDPSLRDASSYTLRVATVTILQFLLDCSTLSCISVH